VLCDEALSDERALNTSAVLSADMGWKQRAMCGIYVAHAAPWDESAPANTAAAIDAAATAGTGAAAKT